MKLSLPIKENCLGDFSVRNSLEVIETLLEDKAGKVKSGHNLVFLVLPASLKAQYPKIKRWALKSSSHIITQVALESTLGKKGFSSIATKLLIQIAAKVGNIPWAPELPKNSFDRVMIVGVDSASDKQLKDKTVVGFCATLNSKFTKFYSATVF